MHNPLVKRDLVDAILELRADVEKQLQANKYYVALNKLDELLAAIRPLEIVEVTVNPVTDSPSARAEPAPVAEPQAEPARVWSGIVQEKVVEGEAARPS
jgi:DNA polymerase II small subunit/DNA polymerase delta subunit B